MKTLELDKLAAEAADADAARGPLPEGEAVAQPAGEGAPAAEPVEVLPPEAPVVEDAMLATVARSFVVTAGAVACGLARVEPLRNDEIPPLTEAVVALVKAYDLARLDARTAAWLALVLALAGPVTVRLPKIGQAVAPAVTVPAGEAQEAR